MDKRKNNGGKREGAGRKSKSEEMQLIEMLNKHIDKDKAIKVLKEKIDEGDFKALQLYMNYMYGKPKETKDVTINAEQPLFNLDLNE
jgi:ribosomal protein S26